jgi:hypothetical protein
VRAHKNLSHCLFILNFLFIFRPVKVNAGAFNLTVGGMAINNAFYEELDAVRFTMAIFPIAYLFEYFFQLNSIFIYSVHVAGWPNHRRIRADALVKQLKIINHETIIST